MSTITHTKDSIALFDFFAVDNHEELSAFSGRAILRQAEYVNDAIRFILSRYEHLQDYNQPLPKAVILLGHSMGGVVARTAMTLPNYIPGSINTIITLSTPHLDPPAPFDWLMWDIYRDVNRFWRLQTHSRENLDLLRNVSIVSLGGGNLDRMISSDLVDLEPILYPDGKIPRNISHGPIGFTIFTSSVPKVWSPADHRQMVWCNQIVYAVANALYQISNVTDESKTIPLLQRLTALRSVLDARAMFSVGSEFQQESLAAPNYDRFNIKSTERFTNVANLPFNVPLNIASPHSYIFKPSSKKNRFAVFSTMPINEVNQNQLLSCSSFSPSSLSLLNCRNVESTLIPRGLPATQREQYVTYKDPILWFSDFSLEDGEQYMVLITQKNQDVGDWIVVGEYNPQKSHHSAKRSNTLYGKHKTIYRLIMIFNTLT